MHHDFALVIQLLEHAIGVAIATHDIDTAITLVSLLGVLALVNEIAS
ncbi:hypothetical protein GCM10027169_18440 [Gordonia jinhuaensis]|uniref:Uncharacterized protein n=1 Tax=Gordonia jinhuaensis TaxID=1517702 RepID=A0A916TJ98_9ACTN|nr:hypothetical protein GCM10011489_37390 [Gordonia jinhuaensis]